MTDHFAAASRLVAASGSLLLNKNVLCFDFLCLNHLLNFENVIRLHCSTRAFFVGKIGTRLLFKALDLNGIGFFLLFSATFLPPKLFYM